MNLNSRLGKKNDAVEEPAEDVVLLALVVSVMSAVASEAAKELNVDETLGSAPRSDHPLMTLLPSPSRALTPEQVIKIQLSALKLNDDEAQDAGLCKVYEFASHANQQITGSVDRFIALLKNPLYRPLLAFKSVEFSRLAVGADCAEQTVTISPGTGTAQVKYTFSLVRESFGEGVGCWLLDSISPN